MPETSSAPTVRRLWRAKLKPLLDAWGYIESLWSLVGIVWRLVLFLISAGAIIGLIGASGAYAFGFLSSRWLLIAVGLSLAFSIGPWAVLWWKQRNGDQQGLITVDYAGIRWLRTTSYYPSGHSVGEAQCPIHKVRLFYRDSATNQGIIAHLREPDPGDLIGLLGKLWCPQGNGHYVDIHTSDSLASSFHALKMAAEALLDAKLADSKRR